MPGHGNHSPEAEGGGGVVRHRFTVDVSSVAPAGVQRSVGDVHVAVDRRDERPVLLWCLPGGGMSRRYFDLDVPRQLGEYSMARHLAGLGFVVVTIDHPGVGDSDAPDDGYTLDPRRVADVNAHVMREVRERLHAGQLVAGPGPIGTRASVGVGHSAGAILTVHQQAMHRTHDALALLGFGGAGLRGQLTEAELAVADDPDAIRAQLADLARARFGEPLPMPRRGSSNLLVRTPMAPEVHEGLLAARSRMLALVGLSSMIPGSLRPDIEHVDVPVFVGVGEHDITGPPRAIPAVFPGADDITLFVLRGAGHNHNVAPNRRLLWDRLALWAGAFARRCE